MSRSILVEVERKLKSEYYVTNDDWLRDCVNYYLSEHNNPKESEVLGFVISQWKLSDLREISNQKPCLPANLAREKCTTLQGNFMLQMEKVCDISESKFKQIEKIRNMSNENIEVTEAEKTQVHFEPKKKRLLRLHLTDGVQDIMAIEYKPIRFLNDSLLPGYKFLIQGPVTCRRGIIMLDETSIKEIGGEVDSLLIPNALENVLARALNLPENPDPYSNNEEAIAQEDLLFEDDFDIGMAERVLDNLEPLDIATPVNRIQENSPQNSVKSVNGVQKTSATSVNRGQQNAPQSSINSTNRVQQNSRVQQNVSKSSEPARVSSAVSRTESDMFFEAVDDFDFFEDDIIDCTSKLQSKPAALPKQDSPIIELNDDLDDYDFNDHNPILKSTASVSAKQYSQNVKPNDDLDDFDFNDHNPVLKSTASVSAKQHSPNVKLNDDLNDFDFNDHNPILKSTTSVSAKQQSPNVKLNDRKDSKCESSLNDAKPSNMPIKNNLSNKNVSTVKKDESHSTLNFGERSNIHPTTTKLSNLQINNDQDKQSATSSNKRSIAVLSPVKNKGPAEKMRCSKPTTSQKAVSNNRKITDFVKRGMESPTRIAPQKSHDSVSDLLSANVTKTICKTVKAKLTKFDNLSKNGQFWQLDATITDNTGSIDTTFSSEILESMLGFSVAEFSIKKKLKKTDPTIEAYLRQGFRDAEKKLSELDGLMEIELAPNQKPKVIKIINQ